MMAYRKRGEVGRNKKKFSNVEHVIHQWPIPGITFDRQILPNQSAQKMQATSIKSGTFGIMYYDGIA